MINDIVQNDDQSPPETLTPDEVKQSVIIIGDSNTQRNKELLDCSSTKWTITNHIFNTTQLLDSLKSDEMVEKMKEQDCVVIAQGTNDLRHGNIRNETIAKNLATASETIHQKTGKPVLVCQVPPLKPANAPGTKSKARVHNKRVADLKVDGAKPVLVEDRFENLLDEDVLINDGVHLNREGAKLMLKAITDALGEMTPQPSGCEQKNERRATDSDNKKTIKMTVNAETANHIVGKKGATVIRIERMFHVKVRNQREGQECHFTISGTEQAANDAQNYIRNIIENTKKRQDPELPICRYYADKGCRNKDKCRFLHPTEGAQKRKRSAERPTRKSPPKKHSAGTTLGATRQKKSHYSLP